MSLPARLNDVNEAMSVPTTARLPVIRSGQGAPGSDRSRRTTVTRDNSIVPSVNTECLFFFVKLRDLPTPNPCRPVRVRLPVICKEGPLKPGPFTSSMFASVSVEMELRTGRAHQCVAPVEFSGVVSRVPAMLFRIWFAYLENLTSQMSSPRDSVV